MTADSYAPSFHRCRYQGQLQASTDCIHGDGTYHPRHPSFDLKSAHPQQASVGVGNFYMDIYFFLGSGLFRSVHSIAFTATAPRQLHHNNPLLDWFQELY